MNARTEFVAPPYVANMQRVDSYADIDEILRSEHFIQGSHRESGMFFGGSLLVVDGSEHMAKRQMFSPLVSKAAMQFYESGALGPVIAKVMEELTANTGTSVSVEEGTGTEGTMIRILRTLYEAGAEMDPDLALVRSTLTH